MRLAFEFPFGTAARSPMTQCIVNHNGANGFGLRPYSKQLGRCHPDRRAKTGHFVSATRGNANEVSGFGPEPPCSPRSALRIQADAGASRRATCGLLAQVLHPELLPVRHSRSATAEASASKSSGEGDETGSLAPWMVVLSAQAPTRQYRRQTKNQVGAWAHSLLAEAIMAASGRYHRRSVLESTRLLNS